MKERRVYLTERNHYAQTINDVIYIIENEDNGYINDIRMSKTTMKKIVESMGIKWVKGSGSSTHYDDIILSGEVAIGSYSGYGMSIDNKLEDDIIIITYDNRR